MGFSGGGWVLCVGSGIWNVPMADASDCQFLTCVHGYNKIPHDATWWRELDLLEWRVRQLALEHLCSSIRDLPIADRLSLQNQFGISWLQASAYETWMAVWFQIHALQRPALVAETYVISSEFAASVMEGVYSSQVCSRPGFTWYGLSVCLSG